MGDIGDFLHQRTELRNPESILRVLKKLNARKFSKDALRRQSDSLNQRDVDDLGEVLLRIVEKALLAIVEIADVPLGRDTQGPVHRLIQKVPHNDRHLAADLLSGIFRLCAFTLIPYGLIRSPSYSLASLFEASLHEVPHLMMYANPDVEARLRSMIAMLCPSKLATLEPVLRQPPRSPFLANTDQRISSSKILRKEVRKNRPSEDYVSLREAILRKLNEAIFRPHFRSNGVFFGGAVNGFELCQSDIDLCVPMPLVVCSSSDDASITPPKLQSFRRSSAQTSQVACCDQLLDVFAKSEFCVRGVQLEYLSQSRIRDNTRDGSRDFARCTVILSSQEVIRAKVPLLKCKFTIDHQDRKPRRQDIEMDIVFDNLFGILNSRMLRIYSEMHPKVQELGLFVKIWVKSRDICRPRRDLVPYSWILLVIHFLQVWQGLPNLQENPPDWLTKIWAKRPCSCRHQTPVEFFADRHNVWHYDPLSRHPSGSRIGDLWREVIAEGLYKRDRRTGRSAHTGTWPANAILINPYLEILPGRSALRVTSGTTIESLSSRNGKIRKCCTSHNEKHYVPYLPASLPSKSSSSRSLRLSCCSMNESVNAFPRRPDRFHLIFLIFDFMHFYAFDFNFFEKVATIRGCPMRPSGTTLRSLGTTGLKSSGLPENDNSRSRPLCFSEVYSWGNFARPYRTYQTILAASSQEDAMSESSILLQKVNSLQLRQHFSICNEILKMPSNDSSGDEDRSKRERLTKSALPGSKAVAVLEDFRQYGVREGVMTIEDPFEEGRYLQPKTDDAQERMSKEFQRAIRILSTWDCPCFSKGKECCCLLEQLLKSPSTSSQSSPIFRGRSRRGDGPQPEKSIFAEVETTHTDLIMCQQRIESDN